MTQEVQPLAWQKRTNLEEHQQFFSKINEIIANLAPTVNEAEAAIAQATQAIASANAAVSTANAASASADAASQQAQTAADTVAGYDARLVAAESKNTQQDTAISALQTADGQNVKLTGDQNISGIKTVPTEATGVRSQQIANSAKVGAELDNYAPMVRNTGNMKISGSKQFQSTIFRGAVSADMIANPETSIGATILSVVDKMTEETHNTLGSIVKVRNTNGENYLDLQSTSYGFVEGGVQKRIDIFIRLLVSEGSGNAQLILYRTKRNADGTGDTDVKSKVLASITAAGVIT